MKRPRKVMLMVKAGKAVDDFIETLLPHLEPGDLIIDGGNSHFPDTIRRTKYLESKGLLYIGTGVSGGEEGARFGPSMMPGGSPDAWPLVKDMFQAICAKTPERRALLRLGGRRRRRPLRQDDPQRHRIRRHAAYLRGLPVDEAGPRASATKRCTQIFAEWNKGELDSYLIEITRDILGYKDENGEYVVDEILDTAGQKGTGKWTSVSALDLGMPVTLIGEAVMARCLSAMKESAWRHRRFSAARSRNSTATRRRLSRTSARRCWLLRLSPMRRVSCCCARPPRSTSGT